jgi:hypothetical protein
VLDDHIIDGSHIPDDDMFIVNNCRCVVDGYPVMQEKIYHSRPDVIYCSTIREYFTIRDANGRKRFLAKRNAKREFCLEEVLEMFRCRVICYFFDKTGSLILSLDKNYMDYIKAIQHEDRNRLQRNIARNRLTNKEVV